MTRPCTHGRLNLPAESYKAVCPICELSLTRPEYNVLWENIVYDKTFAVCKHRNEDPLPMYKSVLQGLDPIKLWYQCAKGFGENGFVCPCQQCNPSCGGYELPLVQE